MCTEGKIYMYLTLCDVLYCLLIYVSCMIDLFPVFVKIIFLFFAGIFLKPTGPQRRGMTPSPVRRRHTMHRPHRHGNPEDTVPRSTQPQSTVLQTACEIKRQRSHAPLPLEYNPRLYGIFFDQILATPLSLAAFATAAATAGPTFGSKAFGMM